MNDACEAIKARIQALEEELRTINPAAPWNAERIASRQRGLVACRQQLDRVERLHAAWLENRAVLLARCDQFKDMPRGR